MSFIGLGFCFSNPLNWQWKLKFLLPLIQFQEEFLFSLTYHSMRLRLEDPYSPLLGLSECPISLLIRSAFHSISNLFPYQSLSLAGLLMERE